MAGDAARYIDPVDERDIIEAFLKLVSDNVYREELQKKAVIQAKMFS